MKLLTRTTIYYALLSVPLLILAGIAFYIIITAQINSSLDESLLNTEKQLKNYWVDKQDTISYTSPDGDIFINFSIGQSNNKTEYKDTLIFSEDAKEYLPYRILSTEKPYKDGYHHITIRKASIESEDLVDGIIFSTIVIFVILFIGLIGLNWWINQKLWRPFYRTITHLSNYKIGEKSTVIFDYSHITEFNTLNKSLDQLLVRIGQDYQKQKQFTENASHEMQTPVAVMQSKIDLLIQSKNLKEEDMQLIGQLMNSIQKLSYLNRSLLLLSKIESKQFGEAEQVSICDVVENSLLLYESQRAAKNIQIIKLFKDKPLIKINRGLCEILINNLVQNAIRHNDQNGTLEINIDEVKLEILNSGNSIKNPDVIFERFAKSDLSIDSIGLGLAIVKEIANVSGMSITYQSQGGKNSFVLLYKINN